jgi:hypothetical protein
MAAGRGNAAEGRRLLSSVERLVASNDKLRREAAQCRAVAQSRESDQSELDAAAAEAVRRYSNRAAVAGGASALPGIIPGAGLAIGVGTALAEVAVLLKLEVEMALVLLELNGFDIEDPRERQLGFLMASVATYEAGAPRNAVVDIARAEGEAIWNYAPRRLARMTVSVMALILAVRFARGLVKLVPFLGIAVGTGMNKVLTTRVGERIRRDLRARRDLVREAAKPKIKAKAPPKKKKASR